MSSELPTANAAAEAKRPVIVVIGMHRSGTSMAANIVHALGANMGDRHFNVSPENAKGHWERPMVVGFNDRIFSYFNRDWGQSSHILTLPEHWLGAPFIKGLRREAAQWLSDEMKKVALYGFKDPRTSLLLKFWEQVFDDVGASPHYIFCARSPAQVARSLAKRDGMEKVQAECRWMNYNVEAIRAIGSSPVCILPYERWFDDPESNTNNLLNFLRLPEPSPMVLYNIIDTELRHDSSDVEASSAATARMWQLIFQNSDRNTFDPKLRFFVELVAEFNEYIQPALINTELLRNSVAQQTRVIGDLQNLVRRMRGEDIGVGA